MLLTAAQYSVADELSLADACDEDDADDESLPAQPDSAPRPTMMVAMVITVLRTDLEPF